MSDSSKQLHDAFRNTVSAYQEAAGASGTIKAIDYSDPQAGKASYTVRTSMVRPSTSDFAADVEISARRCLTSGELPYFELYYKTGKVVVSTLPRGAVDTALEEHVRTFSEKQRAAVLSLDNRMREKLGRRFKEVEIYPVSVYMEPKDIHGRKLKTKRNDNVISIQASAAPYAENKLAEMVEAFETAITASQLAKILQCSRREIYKLVDQKRIPALKVGTMVRLDPCQVADWIRSKMTIAA
jgi:excisionase family DNA binding protein